MSFLKYVQDVRCNESKTIKMLLWDHVKCPQFRNSEKSAIAGVISIHFFVVLAGDLAPEAGCPRQRKARVDCNLFSDDL